MSEIKRGDLVMVVRVDHTCAESMLGRVYVVDGVPIAHPGIACQQCGTPDIATANSPIATMWRLNGRDAGVPQRWLKKIDPPAEMKDTETEKELTV